MPFNGSGVYTPPAIDFPAVAGTLIESSKYNGVINDQSTALSTCITKDGQTTVTANIPFGGYRLTNAGAATALTDAVRANQVQNSSLTYLTSVSGADTITATAAITPAAYAAGQMFQFVAAGANTGAVTLNVSGLGAKDVTKNGSTALAAGDIPADATVSVMYDGTQFQLMRNGAPSDGPITTSGLTMSTARILGRTTAGTGAVEELTAAQAGPLVVQTGTWTPVLTFSTPGDLSVSYSVQTGIWSRIGTEIEYVFAVVTSAFTHTTASGGLRLTGLPVAAATIADMAWFGSVLWQGVTKANYTDAQARINSGNQFIDFTICGSAQSQSNITAADMPTGGTVIIRGSIRCRAES